MRVGGRAHSDQAENVTRPVYAADLLEETVLLAQRTLAGFAAREFRRRRDRVYDIQDPDEREARFRTFHREWFARLGLGRVLEQALERCEAISGRVTACRVLRAVARDEECADLLDLVDGGRTGGLVLVLCLRPLTLAHPAALQALLDHELMHVADMLDPAFGYERSLRHSTDEPSPHNLLRTRYRVLWDTTIDGRLAREGRGSDAAREARRREFVGTFRMLGARAGAAFDRWFAEAQPTHALILAFAEAPGGAGRDAADGRCPTCRFPVVSLDPRVHELSAATLAVIEASHPDWHPALGLCPQCVDLYAARAGAPRHLSA